MTLPDNWTDGRVVDATDFDALEDAINAATLSLRRPLRNTIAAIGDSLTAYGSQGDEGPRPVQYQGWLYSMYFQLLSIMTHQRIRNCGGNYAVSSSWFSTTGTNGAVPQIQQLPYVLAMNPLPGAVVLAVNGAEILSNTSYSFANNAAVLKTMVTECLAAGVVPILFTIPALLTNAYPVSQATIKVELHQWNAFLRRLAYQQGLPLIDAFAAVTQQDGTRIPGTTYADGIHPNGVGNQLIVQQALSDGLADLFPPNSQTNTIRTTDGLDNLMNNGTINYGLFTTDSNSDGIADGLVLIGGSTATCSLVAPVPTDELAGNWQQIVVNSGNQGTLAYTVSGWSVGDTIAFSCRVQTSGMVASQAYFILALTARSASNYTISDGSTPTTLDYGLGNWIGVDLGDGEVYAEFVVPPTTSSITFYGEIVSVPTGSATLRFGEVTIRNLTTQGLLV